MRCFLAVTLPPDIIGTAEALAAHCLQRQTQGLKAVDKAQLHLTLHFLPEINQAQAASIIAGMDRLRDYSCAITAQGTGGFPDLGSPHTLWMGITAPDCLYRLHQDLSGIVQGLGLPCEQRDYVPHITFLRAKQGLKPELQSYLRSIQRQSWGVFSLRQLVLYQSRLSAAGPEYTPLYTRVFTYPESEADQ